MGDISLIEFIVYGIICYSGIVMLSITSFKPMPAISKGTIVRVIYLLPSLFCAFVLASSGVNIVITTVHTSDLIKDINSSRVWSDISNQSNIIELQNPVWITIHMMIFFTIFIYIIYNILMLFFVKDKQSGIED